MTYPAREASLDGFPTKVPLCEHSLENEGAIVVKLHT
jgi:hypothetical protein